MVGFRILTVFATLAVGLVPAQAAVVLDRSTFSANIGDEERFGDFGGPYGPILQTHFVEIKAGQSGTLSRIDLKLAKYYGTGLLELVLYDGGRQGSTVPYVYTNILGPGEYKNALQTVTFDVDALPATLGDVISFDLSAAGLHLDAGHLFSFMLRSIGPVPTTKAASAQTTTDASTFATTYFSANSGIPYFDDRTEQVMQFQTFIDDGRPPAAAGAVPEPGSWMMMVGGFGLVGGTARRSRGLRPARAG